MNLSTTNHHWGTVIPAGGLVPDPLATAIGAPRKALAPINGLASVTHVAQAVLEALPGPLVVVGGEDLAPHLPQDLRVRLVPESTGQIANAQAGVDALPPEIQSVLFLPCDAPLLTPQAISEFVRKVEDRADQPLWFAAGLADSQAFRRLFPQWDMNTIKLKDGEFNSGPYFATSRPAFHQGADLFTKMSEDRKSILKMLLKLGIGPLLRYLFHQITLAEAEARLGHVLGGQALILPNCDPLGIADIDEVEDLDQILAYLKARS